VRAEPLLPLAQQLFHPSACARQVFRMSPPLPLLWSAVIRALERLGAHPAGLGAHKARPLAGRFPVSAPSRPVCARSGPRPGSPRLPQCAGNAAPWRKSGLELQFGCSAWARGGLLMRTVRSGEHQPRGLWPSY